jgi:cytosine deaminase
LLIAALENGADLIGACPYTDTDSIGQIDRIFALARRFDVDIDMHLDFDLETSGMTVEEVCRQTERHGWGGRVAVGHCTKLSALPPDRLADVAKCLASAGVAVTVLPATDLFLMGRGHDHLVPRGVAPAPVLLAAGVNCTLSTNNMLNPFTPFGDGSLIRMANLFANIAQLGRAAEWEACFDMVTRRSAALMNLTDYGLAVGNPADLVVLDARSPAEAVTELAEPVVGWKNGRRTFSRALPALHRP